VLFAFMVAPARPMSCFQKVQIVTAAALIPWCNHGPGRASVQTVTT